MRANFWDYYLYYFWGFLLLMVGRGLWFMAVIAVENDFCFIAITPKVVINNFLSAKAVKYSLEVYK